MNPLVVVVINGLVNSFYKLASGVKSVKLETKVRFKVVVKRFLVSVLPRGSFLAHGDPDAQVCHQLDVIFVSVLDSLIRMDDIGSSFRVLKSIKESV